MRGRWLRQRTSRCWLTAPDAPRTLRVSELAELVTLERGYGPAHDGDERVKIVTVVELDETRAASRRR